MQKHTMRVPIIKINDNSTAYTNDTIIKEDRLNLYLNGSKIISTMCILKDQDSYAVGFLMSEGVIENIDDIRDIDGVE